MINILSSDARAPSDVFSEDPRRPGENNIEWLSRNMKDDNQATLVMVGGRSQSSFRLRIAQAHVRHDLLPSYWSHTMLIANPDGEFGKTTVYEISLEPSQGFGYPTPFNGVQEGRLSQYGRIRQYPNIALLRIPVPLEKILTPLARFKKQRAVMDAVDLIVHWLAYVWGVSRSANPLLDGLGIPSAAMLEIVIGASEFDLTPGLESRSSCPEAIWQAAKWWHHYYQDQDKPAISGSFYTPHEIE